MRYVKQPLPEASFCSKCNRTKPIAEFDIRKRGSMRGKPYGICKGCRAICSPNDVKKDAKKRSKEANKTSPTSALIRKLYKLSGWIEFRKSEYFKKIRRDALDLHGRFCACCAEPAYAVYFSRFESVDLLGQTYKHIHPICDSCMVAVVQFTSLKDQNRQFFGMVEMGEHKRSLKFAGLYEPSLMTNP